MGTPTITVQLPVTVYTRLQTLAIREHTDPVEMIDRLVTIEPASWAGRIVRDPQLRAGRPLIAGSGVTVRTVAGHYKLGLTPEEIADQLELDLAAVYTALAYYQLHQAEIEADMQANTEEAVQHETVKRPLGY